MAAAKLIVTVCLRWSEVVANGGLLSDRRNRGLLQHVTSQCTFSNPFFAFKYHLISVFCHCFHRPIYCQGLYTFSMAFVVALRFALRTEIFLQMAQRAREEQCVRPPHCVAVAGLAFACCSSTRATVLHRMNAHNCNYEKVLVFFMFIKHLHLRYTHSSPV